MIWLKWSAIAILASLAVIFVLDKLFPPPIERGRIVSVMISDRDDRPLRAIPLANGTWRFAADLDEIDPINPIDRKSTRLNSSHPSRSRMPSSA